VAGDDRPPSQPGDLPNTHAMVDAARPPLIVYVVAIALPGMGVLGWLAAENVLASLVLIPLMLGAGLVLLWAVLRCCKRITEVHDSLEAEVTERTARLAEANWDLALLSRDLRERVKELDCLYGASELMADSDRPVGEVLRAIAVLLPTALQHPELGCARIIFDGEKHETQGFRETPWSQSTDIRAGGETRGSVEVCYLEERPEANGGPFLKEERDLVDGIARTVGEFVERQKAREALRESEERYRTLFDGAAEGILVADLATKRFTYANAAICRMLGYAADELMQMGVMAIHPKDALDDVIAEFEAQAQGEKILAQDLPCLRKDGTVFYADINTASFELNGSRCNIGFFTDVTERREAEAARERAAKLTATVETAGAVCHELGQPMQAATGYAQLMLAQMETGSPLRGDLQKIVDSIMRMARITRKLNDITRYETKNYLGGKIVDIHRAAEGGGEGGTAWVGRRGDKS